MRARQSDRSMLAAIAGVMVAVMNNLVEPSFGSVVSYKSLAIIVLGGLGNMNDSTLARMEMRTALEGGWAPCPAPRRYPRTTAERDHLPSPPFTGFADCRIRSLRSVGRLAIQVGLHWSPSSKLLMIASPNCRTLSSGSET